MNFLQKMIDYCSQESGQQLTVRTSKVVAGLEPEATNEWLQIMFQVATGGAEQPQANEMEQ